MNKLSLAFFAAILLTSVVPGVAVPGNNASGPVLAAANSNPSDTGENKAVDEGDEGEAENAEEAEEEAGLED